VAAPLLAGAAFVIRDLRLAADITECRENLRRIGLALHAYHDEHKAFPPAHVRGPDGRLWHSWRVLILPHLGEEELYRQYRLDEPWDGPHNRELIPRVPAVLACAAADASSGRTSYFAVVSPRTMWPAHRSLRISDVTDGSSNTVHVVEDPRDDVAWTEPRDYSTTELRNATRAVQSPHFRGDQGPSRNMLFVDGSVRSIQIGADRSRLASLLTPAFGREWIAPEDWPQDLAGDPPPLDFGPMRSVADLPATGITAVRDAELTPGRSVLWCATFQIVWDAFRDKLQVQSVPFHSRPALAEALDGWRYPADALSPDCYTLMLEGVDSASAERVRAKVREQFPGADSHAAPITEVLPGFRLYSYLEKRMPFAQEFDRLPEATAFRASAGTVQVAAFGAAADELEGLGSPVLDNQVRILDYVGDDDFIVELTTAAREHDRIILARVDPESTLRQTWEAVQRRIDAPHPWHDRPHLMSVEPLVVPVLVFNLRREFVELLGATLDLPGSDWDQFWIESAWQNIRLRLDEHGADFVSEAEVAPVGSLDDPAEIERPPPPKPRRFVFDRPFLIVLREGQTNEPYFIGWIGNTDLMEAEEGR
jgi:prepilin-type processing-associated H-X9-DG protein